MFDGTFASCGALNQNKTQSVNEKATPTGHMKQKVKAEHGPSGKEFMCSNDEKIPKPDMKILGVKQKDAPKLQGVTQKESLKVQGLKQKEEQDVGKAHLIQVSTLDSQLSQDSKHSSKNSPSEVKTSIGICLTLYVLYDTVYV